MEKEKNIKEIHYLFPLPYFRNPKQMTQLPYTVS